MRRRIPGLTFEAVAEAGTDVGGGLAEPGGDDTPVDVTAAPGHHDIHPDRVPPPETPDTDTDEGFDPAAYFSTPEGQALLDAQVAARIPQPEPELEQEPALAPPDPFSENYEQEMAQYLQARDERLIQAIQGSPAIQQAEQAHYEQWADQQFAAIEKDLKLPDGQHLDDDTRQFAVLMAAGQRPPAGSPAERSFDPAAALRQAAQTLHARVQTERTAAVEAYKQSLLATDGGAQEPGPGGGGARIERRDPSESYDDIATRYFG